MRQEILEKYDAEKIYASLPADRGELFLGYRPAADDAWREQFRQTLAKEPDRQVYRTVFEPAGDAEGGVVVEVAECASARDAVDVLLDTLAENQAAELPPGPEALGPAAFRNPEQAPPALFYARANLRISIHAQTRDGGGVDDWLGRITEELDLAPEETRPGLEIRRRTTRDPRTRLAYELRWKKGDDAWLKFVADGATLERDAGELILGRPEGGFTVRGWVLERGREPYGGIFRRSPAE